jgi:hypothetical protein
LTVDTNDIDGNIDVTAGSLNLRGVKGEIKNATHIPLDTDRRTSYSDTYTDPCTGQTVSIAGSSRTLTADVTVAFGLVLDTDVTGRGNLVFTSDGSVRDITVTAGSNINLKGLTVDGDVGNIVMVDCICNVQNNVQKVKVSGSAGDIMGTNVKDVNVGSAGNIVALLGSVSKVISFDDIESIFATNNITNVTAGGNIGSIEAGGSISTIRAEGIDSIVAGSTIKNVIVTGDIRLIEATSSISKVTAGGDIDEISSKGSVSYIDADDIGKIVSDSVRKVSARGNIDVISAVRDVTDVSAGGTLHLWAGNGARSISAHGGTYQVGGRATRISGLEPL